MIWQLTGFSSFFGELQQAAGLKVVTYEQFEMTFRDRQPF